VNEAVKKQAVLADSSSILPLIGVKNELAIGSFPL
jgi:hypothetical protein